ncbi:MAG TPA: right-handed parallel beta-helix repeat-containing protein, partial [Niastella sp.]
MRILKRLHSYCSSFVIRAILICCVCAPAIVQAQLPGGVYTIDNRLPTSGKNYNSFNAAVIAMLNGISGSVTFNVAAGSGPYNEQVFITDQIGSSATKLLTFNCNGVTLRFLSTNQQARAGIKIEGADYVIIDNLKIEALATTSTEFGYGVHITNDADHNIIRNCTINVNLNSDVPQNNEGIVINGSDAVASTQSNSYCDSNQIINNSISGGNTGVTMSSNPVSPQTPINMKGNQVLNNKITNYWYAGIYLLYNDGTLLQGNDISRPAIVAPIQYSFTGILLHEGSFNTSIIGNRIHDLVIDDPAATGSFIHGISVATSFASPATTNIIANNLIYDFESTGQQIGINLDGGSYMNVYHNTISLENKVYMGSSGTYGIYTNTWAGLNVMNNIFTISRTTTASNYGFYYNKTVPSFNNCDRNLYYIAGSTGTNAVGRVGSNSQVTLANWRTATGKDLLSVSSDPVYKDANNFILEPTDKNIDNLGQYVGIQNDFAGAIRNNDHPDIGAYEFLTPKCTGAAVGGTTTMLPGSPICEGSPMAMNLSGNSFGDGQTYQWQSSSTINGTYTNTGAALAHPATNITAVSTLYYRVAVTCSTQVDFSVPVQVIVTPSLAAATYTINSAQATGGTNFQTFNDALNAIRCGIRGPVVFNVVDNGTPYREQLNITSINGTSTTNTVTFKGNGAALALAAGTNTERAVVKFNGAAYFIFDGLKVNPEATTSGYGIGFQFINGAHNNTIKNCTINMSTTSGLTDLVGICMSPSATAYTNTSTGSFCDSNIVTGNTIIGGQYGITCTSSDTYP